MLNAKNMTRDEISALLRGRGINPTGQRVEIARVVLSQCAHLSAEEIYSQINTDRQRVSKATVYNTLGLFAEKGLVREVIADPTKIFYDPNTAPHHHFYDISTGVLTDIDANAVQVSGIPPLPDGASLEGVDVVVRLRTK